MRRIARFTATIAAVALFASVAVAPGAEEPSLHGFVRYQASARYLEGDVIRNAATAEVDLEYRGSRADLRINPYFETGAREAAAIGVREAYIDLFLPAVDVRLGKQIVIWGKADGVAITDVISPKDLSEFLIPEFRELRRGVTAATANLYLGPVMLEGVYVPVPTFSELPERDSVWYVMPDTPVPPTYEEAEPISRDLADGEWFGRLSFRGRAVDVELSGGYLWSNEPSLTVTKSFSAPGVISDITIQPEYYRQWMGGGGVSTAVGPLVLRGESAYFTPERFPTTELSDADGYVERDYLQSLVGVDTALAGVDLSVQVLHQFIPDYAEPLRQDEHTFTATFRAATAFLHDTLSVELMSYIGFQEPDALVKLGLTYAFTEALDVGIETDVFFGDAGRFGRYDDNDLITLEAKYSY